MSVENAVITSKPNLGFSQAILVYFRWVIKTNLIIMNQNEPCSCSISQESVLRNTSRTCK